MLTVVNVIQWQNKSKILKASPQYWCYYSYLTFFIIVKNCDTLRLLINWNISRLLENNSSDDENLLHTTRDAKSCKIHQHGKIKREHISNRTCLKNSFFSQVARKRVKGSPFLPSLEIVRSFPGSCGSCSGKLAIILWNFKVLKTLEICWVYTFRVLLKIPWNSSKKNSMRISTSKSSRTYRCSELLGDSFQQQSLCPNELETGSIILIKYKEKSIQPGTLSNHIVCSIYQI